MIDSRTSLPRTDGRAGGVLVYAIAALLWTIVLGLLAGGATSRAWIGLLWGICAATLWFVSLRDREAPLMRTAFTWWLRSLVAPAVVLLELIEGRSRVEAIERDVERLKRHVRTLQETRVAPEAPEDVTPRPEPAPAPAGPRPAPERTRAAAVPPRPAPAAPTPESTRPLPGQQREPAIAFDWRGQLEAADLLGAKALALAGGVVTLLGVVFFFVLAANRGWIGPGIRIACGATASALVFGTGFWLRRRFGETFSSLAAVGAGIAGAYATLLAAASLYDMVPKPVAFVLAAVIASIGLATSLAWESETVAGLGLVGAMVVPGMLVFQGGLSVVGTAFVAIVFAAAAVVALVRRWHTLLAVAGGLSSLQAMGLFADKDFGWSLVVLAAVFWALYLATGIAAQLLDGRDRPTSIATGFVLGSAAFAAYSVATVLGDRHGGRDQGIALLVAGAAYAATAVPLSLRPSGRTLSSLLYALALTAGAIGLADVLSGATLTYVWAGEAAVFAWLAARVRDARFQVASAAYLALAIVHALALESRPDLLFVAHGHPGSGAPPMLAIAIAAMVYAVFARADTEEGSGLLAPVIAAWREASPASFVISLGVAGVAAAYAASLGILELSQALWDGTDRAFGRGHVLVTATWALAGLAASLAFLRRRAWVGVAIAYGWLALTLFKTLLFDATQLAPDQRASAFVAVAVALLIAGIAIHLTLPGRLDPVGATAIVVSLGLALSAGTTFFEGTWLGMDQDGVAVAAVALIYLVAAALVWPATGQRDLRSQLAALGLGVAAVAEGMLLGGVWLVLAWTVTAAALAVLTVALSEPRLQVASGAYVVAAGVAALGLEAPPTHLVVASQHPAHGVASVVLVIVALLAFAWSCRPAAEGDEQDQLQRGSLWIAGTLAVYTASLLILEAVAGLSTAGVHTDFQRGHTAVSALWGVLGLVCLYVGLVKRRRALRLGGFALFGISLGKLFLYDLAALSSVTRALSFLAVGAFLIAGGFFYQRLSAQLEEREAS
jgi:uncharacterized membrane protein